MKRGDKVKADVTIVKVKRGVPSVILVSGHRYVLDPNTKTREGDRR